MEVDAPGHNAYEYQPFPTDQTIRILTLQPGPSHAPLIGHLDFANHHAAPPYETISYVWGNLTRSSTITCSGRTLGLTSSLDGALRQLRHETQPRRLWADQICINQSDLRERGQQVMFMNEVYKNASQILVWLGEDDSGFAEEAFNMVTSLEKLSMEQETNDLTPERRESQLRKYGSSPWLALGALYRLPWFRRIWILQEIGTETPAILHWGRFSIQWETLYHVSLALKERCHLFCKRWKLRTNNVIYLYRRFVAEGSEIDQRTFVYEQHLARHLQATDPRDLVFALLGHYSTKTGFKPMLGYRADYSKPFREVYREVAVRNLTNAPTLEGLNAVQHSRQPKTRNKLMPSWVPDWSEGQWTHLIGYPSSTFRATERSLPILRFLEDDRILEVGGIQLDFITKHSEVLLPAHFEFDHKTAAVIKDLWQNICQREHLQEEERYVNGESAVEAFLETVTASRETTTYGVDRRTSFINGLAYLEKLSRYSGSLELDPQLRALATKGDAFRWSRATSAASNRRFARTGKGYYVLGPKTMRRSDLLVVLFGGKTPFCLRPDRGHFLLLGECYIHGMMDGEAMSLLERDEAASKTFKIW